MKNIFTFKMIKVAGIVMSVVLGLGAMSPAMAASEVGVAQELGLFSTTSGFVYTEVSEGVWHAFDGSTNTIVTDVEAEAAAIADSQIWADVDGTTATGLFADTTDNAAAIIAAQTAAQDYADANDTFVKSGLFSVSSGLITFTMENGSSFTVDISAVDTQLSDSDIAGMGYIKVDTNTQLSESQIAALGFIKVDTNTQLSDSDIAALGFIKVDTNTQLTDSQIAAFGFIKIDLNTQLTEAQVDAFVANNADADTQLSDSDIGAFGYIKVDTNTQLSDSDIAALGFIKVDTNTQLSDSDIAALGYIKVDTNTQLSPTQVRALIGVAGDLSYNATTGVISFSQRTDSAVEVLARNAIDVSGDLSYNALTGVISFTGRTDAQVTALASTAGDASITAALLSGSILSSSDIALAISTAITTAAAGTSTAADGVQNTDIEANAGAIAALQGVDNLTQAEFDAINFDVVSSEDLRLDGLIDANANAISGLDTRLDTAEGTIIANTGAITVLNGDDSVEGSVASDIADAISTAAGAQSTTDGTQTQAINAIGSFESVAAVTAVAEVVEVLAVAEVLYVAPVAAVAGVTGVDEVLGSITGTYTNGGLVITFTINETSEGVWYEGTTPRSQSVVAGYLANSTTTLSDGSTITNVTGSLGTTEVIAVTEVIGVAEVLYVAPVAYVAGVTEVIGTEGTFTGTGELGEVAVAITNEQAARMAADDLLSGRLDTIEGDATVDGSIAKAVSDEATARSDADAAIIGSIGSLTTVTSEVAFVGGVFQATVGSVSYDLTEIAEGVWQDATTGALFSNSEVATLNGLATGATYNTGTVYVAEVVSRTGATGYLGGDALLGDRIDSLTGQLSITTAQLIAAIAEGDAALRSDLMSQLEFLKNEILRVEGSIGTVDASGVRTGQSGYLGGDANLQDNIDAEETRALIAEGILQDNINTEAARVGSFNASDVTSVIEATTNLAAQAAADVVAASLAADSSQFNKTANALALEAVARVANDVRLSGLISAETANRIYEDSKLQMQLNDHEARISFLESLHVVDKSFSKVIDGPNGTKIVMHFDADGTQRGKARTLTFLENPVVHGEFDILWNDAGEAVNAITGKLVDPMTGLEFDEMAGFSAAAVEDVNVFFGDMFITPKTNTTPFDTAFVAEEVAPVAPFSLDAGTFVLPSSASKVGSK